MSLLATITKAAPRAPIITIAGDAGTGKSTLAATFPNPVFIRAEDGVNRISGKAGEPDCFPVLKTGEEIYDQLKALLQEPHDYGTLVIDSVSKLDELFIADILAKDPRAKGVNQALGGYGNGPAAVAAMHSRVRKAAGLLAEKRDIAVVFLAHADLENVKLPDTDDYMRYSLKMMPKSIPFYTDDVDFVGHVRLVSALRGGDDERKRVISDGSREVVCHATAASVSKNGYGITAPLPLAEGENPLLEYMRGKPAPASGQGHQTTRRKQGD